MNTSRKKQLARTALANAIEGPAKQAGTFTWREQTDPIFGHAWWLRGLKEGESATCRRQPTGGFVALAWIGGHYMRHNGRTMAIAMDRLEAEIDKRSLGLFGLDDVTFSRKEESK